MALPLPGEYTTTKCRRCNDITGHIIMLVLDGAIAKVECKACGSVHKYHGDGKLPPKKAAAPAVRHVRAGQTREQAKELGTPRPTAIGRAQEKSKAASRLAAAKIETAWQEAMVRHSAETPVPYAMRGTFPAGTFMEHPTFGRGEVISVTKPDKIEVLFQEGIKILRCVAE